jgi:putative endonuclease
MNPTPDDPDPARAEDRPPPEVPPSTCGEQQPRGGNETSAEQATAEYLQCGGMRILDRNWRCPEGKIDIVAAEHRVLVVCQIQVRPAAAAQTQAPPVSQAKRRRLRRLAIRWLVANGVLFDEVRIDVVRLTRARKSDFTIEHLRGVG